MTNGATQPAISEEETMTPDEQARRAICRSLNYIVPEFVVIKKDDDNVKCWKCEYKPVGAHSEDVGDGNLRQRQQSEFRIAAGGKSA